jgi:hypothetical protein
MLHYQHLPFLIVLLASALPSSRSFGRVLLKTAAAHTRTATQLSAIPEIILQNMPQLEMGLVAAASAAVGALSQQPRVQQLEKDLAVAHTELHATQLDMQCKMAELEDKLFLMDQEFEGQTARFKRQYDVKMKQELEQVTEKLKRDFQYKLEINMDRERSNALSQQLDQVNGQTDREAEISLLRIAKERIEEANRKLVQTLQDSDDELERIRTAASAKKVLFRWFK